MSFSWFPWLVASVLLVGCADDAAVGGSGGGPTGGGPGSGGGGAIDPNPILDRDPQISHDCTEERPMAAEIGAMNARFEGVTSFGGEFFITTLEETFDIAKVGLDGSTGTPLTLVSTPYVTRSSILTRDETSVVALWSEGGDLSFARIDSDLELVTGPTAIPETAAAVVNPSAIVATPTGFALLYGAGNGVTVDLRFLQLDTDGQAVGESTLVAELGEAYGASATMVPTDDGGFAVAFTIGSYADGFSVMFALLDDDGALRFDPRRISQPPGGGLSSGYTFVARDNIVKVGDAYWVTYSEELINYDAMVGSAIIRVGVVDGEGNATLHALQAPVDQIENRAPTFVQLSDGIGLAWTSGSIIWVCGGCITDYDVHFVVLDPETLVPASQVVTHLHQNNGINSPAVAVAGDDLLTGGNLDFHALTIPATGTMRCVAAD